MDYETRLAQAQALYAKPAGKELEGQKFPRGARVKVTDEMPSYMSHFECGFEAIVEYTHGQKYDSSDIKNYSLIQLNENGEPINSISWYEEGQLTLLSDNTGEGKRLIEGYRWGGT